MNTFGLTFGIGGEIFFYPKYGAGWRDLLSKIGGKYNTPENYEMYCYLKYACMDAEAMFLEKIKSIENDKDIPTIK
jgi:hypothetical protein